jgi:hypothetical protein
VHADFLVPHDGRELGGDQIRCCPFALGGDQHQVRRTECLDFGRYCGGCLTGGEDDSLRQGLVGKPRPWSSGAAIYREARESQP